MTTLKRYVYIGITSLILLLASALFLTLISKRKAEKQWQIAVENTKAYSDLFSEARNRNRVFLLTIDQLKYSNDSIFQELSETKRKLKVKDSNLKSLMYVSSEYSKNDTITLRDTIFLSPQKDIDTLLSNEWYSLRVGLRYPSTITVEPKFKSIKHIVVSAKKETINPPKKFILFRWFQKKHTVLNIEVIEKNPYLQNQDNRFIEIIR